jgi:radical SAM superfamily enzyme YgiQ (UPF0313 family)
MRTPSRVVEEVVRCYHEQGIRHFDIEDDNFTTSPERAGGILDGIGEAALSGIRLSAMNGVSASDLTPELAKTLRRSGFSHLDLALVSSDKRSRLAVGRPGGLGQFDEILNRVDRLRFRTTVHMILGLPGESVDNMLETIVYLMARPCLIGANIYYPVPGSRLFSQHRDGLPYQEPAFWRSTLASAETGDHRRDAIMALFYLTRMVNYMKHLLGRPGRSHGKRTPEELIPAWFAEEVLPEDQRRVEHSEIDRQTPWDADRLGIYMLRRIQLKEKIEKVQVRQRQGRTVYLLSDDFADPGLVRKFWARARSTPVGTTGQRHETAPAT